MPNSMNRDARREGLGVKKMARGAMDAAKAASSMAMTALEASGVVDGVRESGRWISKKAGAQMRSAADWIEERGDAMTARKPARGKAATKPKPARGKAATKAKSARRKAAGILRGAGQRAGNRVSKPRRRAGARSR